MCSPRTPSPGAARLAAESRARIDSALRLIEALDFEVELFAKLVAGRLRTHPGYQAILTIPGVGPVLAAVFVAEIGDTGRFGGPAQLARDRFGHTTHRPSGDNGQHASY